MALKLGDQIDKIRAADLEIAATNKLLTEQKRRRAKLEDRLLRSFDKDDIDGCKGKTGVASLRRLRIPQIKNLRRLHKYILKHDALDLLQNRVSSKAYMARLEEGESVPGVEVFTKVSISVRKRGSK